ncbi:MAG TPA: PilN domain-containing protein [Pyrinomonadaceae bacterium]|nr:PilN domain-containing protein [Pyrinomonadaceae bacterium]
MIKINLLESVTERPTGVAMVEERVANPRMQTLLLGLTVFGLLAVGIVFDYVSANSAQAAAKQELENQRRINLQMLAINKERAELEKKAQDIQGRIDAIKKLRESQQGPGAVLQEIKLRFDRVPGLYLKSLEQIDGELTIKGESPNEDSVTKFGQSLEFSSGLFTNLNIETQRDVFQAGSASSTVADPEMPKPEVVSFTVKCTYSATKPQSSPAAKPANQVALKSK